MAKRTKSKVKKAKKSKAKKHAQTTQGRKGKKRAAPAKTKKKVASKKKVAANKPSARKPAKKPRKSESKALKPEVSSKPEVSAAASPPSQQPEKHAKKPRYYLTTAIAYPNGAPHIGHAYEPIATDAIARFKRLDGYDVYFLTGTDEHGIKMLQTATREGITPRELVERNVPRFQAMVKR